MTSTLTKFNQHYGSQNYYPVCADRKNRDKIFMDNYGYTDAVEFFRKHLKPETFEKFTTVLISQVTYKHPFICGVFSVDDDDLPDNNYAVLNVTDGDNHPLVHIELTKDDLDPGDYKFFVHNYVIMAANEW